MYETPGGTILYKAHEVLETLTLDKLTAHKKRELAITFGELVYDWTGASVIALIMIVVTLAVIRGFNALAAKLDRRGENYA